MVDSADAARGRHTCRQMTATSLVWVGYRSLHRPGKVQPLAQDSSPTREQLQRPLGYSSGKFACGGVVSGPWVQVVGQGPERTFLPVFAWKIVHRLLALPAGVLRTGRGTPAQVNLPAAQQHAFTVRTNHH